MNGMKKLLGIIGILALATALLPAQGYADLRGAFAPMTSQDGSLVVNGLEQAAFRPIGEDGIMILGTDGGRLIEEWFAMSNRSLIPGHEAIRSIYLHLTSQQSGYFSKLLHDPTGFISYFDPAWSSDGRFLAYVRTDFDGSNATLFVQEFFVNDDFEAVNGGSYPEGEGSDSPVGSPILVSAAGNPRHPDWSPSGHTLAFDANVAGSVDIYTSDIDITLGTASAPTRRTFVDNKSETDPAWSPNLGTSGVGHEIAYVTNKFGPKVIEIMDLDLSSGDPGYLRLAERNFESVSHNNPDWTSDGGTIYYDAPGGEDPTAVTNVWKLDLATQGKCEIQFDIRADSDPNVSGIVNTTNAGDGAVPFNYFLFTSQAANIGVNIWKANPNNSCLLPLAMGVAMVPPVIDLNDEDSESFTTVMNFPPETRAAGYTCQFRNIGGDGVRLRNSFGIFSPTLLGMVVGNADSPTGTACFDSVDTSTDPNKIRCEWDRRDIAARIVALGLVGQIVPLKMTAYSNQMGRGFQGFGYLRLTDNSLPAPVAMLGSSPNPFNPVTKIRFAVNKPGNYALRLYNVQGALIRTVASRHFDAGTHEATWDGRTNGGEMAASGVYYAKMSGASKSVGSDGISLVLMK
jgi:hypothetical protein